MIAYKSDRGTAFILGDEMKKKPQDAKPQDATVRNVRAANKRDKALLDRIKDLEKRLKAVEKACREFGIEW